MNIADPTNATVSDSSNMNLTSLTATISSPQAGDTLAAVTAGTNITANFSGGVLSLTGSDTAADYQQVLRTVTYNNTNGAALLPGAATISVVASDGTLSSDPVVATVNIGSTVASRLLFYNQSKFDGNNAAINASDDNAIATDKTAYLPGTGTATFANLSSYSRGINGVIVDLAGVGGHSQITANDFGFAMGTTNDLASWTTAPRRFRCRCGWGREPADRIASRSCGPTTQSSKPGWRWS